MNPKIKKLTDAEYNAIKAARSSDLKAVHESAQNAKWRMDHPSAKKCFAVGTAGHLIVLEPDEFEKQVVEYTKRRAGQEWKEFEAENADKLILISSEFAQVKAIRDAVMSHPIASLLVLENGKTEHAIVWIDPVTGMACKCKPDKLLIERRIIVELKTTKDASPRLFASQCAKLNYDIQFAQYSDGVAQAMGEPYETQVIAVSNSAPYEVAVYDVSDEMILDGREKYQSALVTLAECRESGIWPGRYESEIMPLHNPAWNRQQEDDLSAEDFA